MCEELECKAVLPVCVRELKKIAALGGAGIVDEDVEAAGFARCQGGEVRRRIICAQIKRSDGGLAALGADCRGDSFECGLIARGEQEVAACLGECECDAASNAASDSLPLETATSCASPP